MTNGERELMNALNNSADSFDDYFETDNAQRPILARKKISGNAVIRPTSGNPTYQAQFDLTAKVYLATQDVATGLVWAVITPAALLVAVPALATKLLAFFFGYSDFTTGFANAKKQMPLTGGWRLDSIIVYGKDYSYEDLYGSNFYAQVGSKFTNGDLVLHFMGGTVGASKYHAYVVINCSQVAYGALLNAMASAKFVINNIRYIMADTSAVGLAQYENQINLIDLSLFGKLGQDSVSPNSFKNPKDFQNGIIDVPIGKGLTKEQTMGTYINYNVAQIQWSMFVATKLSN
jgi:hypothetical protein